MYIYIYIEKEREMINKKGEKYVSGGLFENKWEVGTKSYNCISQYI